MLQLSVLILLPACEAHSSILTLTENSIKSTLKLLRIFVLSF